MKKKFQKIIANHPMKSRRDFLAQGFGLGVGYAMAPSLLSLLQINNAYGAENCITDVGGNIDQKTPVIIIDLAGGGNIAGSNVIVGDQAGQHSLLSTYDRLGIPDSLHPSNNNMNSEMGLKFHSDSGMLQGIQAHTSSQIRQKCEGAVFCAISNDDTSNNPHNPVYWLNKAGARGRLVQTIGTRSSMSGGRSIIPNLSYDPTVAPVPVSRPEDCVELVSLGRISSNFSTVQAQRILKTIEYMSESRLKAFSEQTLPEQVREVAECGFAQDPIDARVHGTDPMFNSTAIDPRNDNDVTAVYNNLGDGNQRKEASVAKLVLDGYVGAGTIEMGGYDYHNRDRTDTDQRDFRAGEAIGRILALAERKQKDVMIYVFTDGGISSNLNTSDPNANGKYMFTNDDGQRASTFSLLYKYSGGRPNLRHTGNSFNTHTRQLGWFKPNTAVERSANVVSNNVVNLAKVITLNYLALHGEENTLEDVVGDNPFGANLDNYIIFGNNS
jgi:hypothetical protein